MLTGRGAYVFFQRKAARELAVGKTLAFDRVVATTTPSPRPNTDSQHKDLLVLLVRVGLDRVRREIRGRRLGLERQRRVQMNGSIILLLLIFRVSLRP